MNSGSISSPRKTGQSISDEFIKHQKSHQLEMNEPLRMLIILPGRADSLLLNKYSSRILKYHTHRISPHPTGDGVWPRAVSRVRKAQRLCPAVEHTPHPRHPHAPRLCLVYRVPSHSPTFFPPLASPPVCRTQPLDVCLTANFSLSSKNQFPLIQRKCPSLQIVPMNFRVPFTTVIHLTNWLGKPKQRCDLSILPSPNPA